jgi:apolipoprotein N-acyltransferase
MIFLYAVVFGLLFCLITINYKYKTILYPLSFIFAWLVFEYSTNFTEFQFPWFNIGYGLKNSLPLLQVLEIGGLPLLNLLIFAINILFYYALTRKRKLFIVTLSILIIWFCLGSLRLNYVKKHSKQEDFKISLLQGNIEQELKWQPGMLEDTFDIYESLTRETHEKDSPNLIIYPEAALPSYLFYDREKYFRIINMVIGLQTSIFTGFPHYINETKYKGQPEPRLYYNAANLFNPYTFREENYYKNVLVPFGERTPLLNLFPILWKIQMGQANFERGDSTVVYTVDGFKFAPLICFEIAFPVLTGNAAKKHNPDFWVTITNDAWFYRSVGTHQHAVMAIYRTIETRKPVFRAANTGFTFYTTPEGTIHDITNLFERKYITGNLTLYNKVTPFVAYGYLLPIVFILFFALQIAHIFIKKRERL